MSYLGRWEQIGRWEVSDIDFLHKVEREGWETYLREKKKEAASPPDTWEMSGFGVLEMTSGRLGPPFPDKTTDAQKILEKETFSRSIFPIWKSLETAWFKSLGTSTQYKRGEYEWVHEADYAIYRSGIRVSVESNSLLQKLKDR